MTAIASALVLMFMVIWMTYSGIHLYSRFQQLPPGQTVTTGGITYKLIGLTRADVITDGDGTDRAPAGATYILAVLEIVTEKKEPTCTVDLVGDGKRTWDTGTAAYERKLPGFCGDDDGPRLVPGKPWRFEQIFLIPAAFSDRLYGVSVGEASSAAPIKVLTPQS